MNALLDAESWVARVAAAEQALAAADERLGRVIAVNGPLDAARYRRQPFAALIGAIIGQQLSARAAGTIAARVAQCCEPAPGPLAACAPQLLRAAGLSAAKTRAVQAAARAVAQGQLKLDELAQLRTPPADVHAALCALPGIGPWTADMFLMFARPDLDVFAPGDLGLRRALMRLDGLTGLPDGPAGSARAAVWSPYRTVACWHLWKWLETTPGASPGP